LPQIGHTAACGFAICMRIAETRLCHGKEISGVKSNINITYENLRMYENDSFLLLDIIINLTVMLGELFVMTSEPIAYAVERSNMQMYNSRK